MPFGLGLPELLIILVIALVVLGPKRLPGLGRQLGTGMREFRDAISGRHAGQEQDDERPAVEAPAEERAPTRTDS
jgi:sec-independent protein translocase protein TatA